MKKFSFVLMAATVLVAALSCEKENPIENNNPENVNVKTTSWSFTANVENPVTKMGDMDSEGNFAWESGDEIKILYAGGSTTATATLEGGIATFEPSIPGGVTDVWMVYPSSMTASLDGDKLVIGMPGMQKDALSGWFVAKAAVGDASISFMHPVCYFKLIVDGDGNDVTDLELTSAGADITATSLSLAFDASGIPSATAVSGSASLSATFSGTGTYYIPVLPDMDFASGDLKFQFYRGGSNAEKAGAYKHNAAVTSSRAHIKNWKSLPAQATNRYVSTSGSTSNNGASADAPWSFLKFQSFMENSTKNGNTQRDADGLALYDGINIRFAAGTYTIASKVTTNISIKTNLIGDSEGVTAFSGNDSAILFDVYKVSGDSYSFKNITFQNGSHTSNDGGAFRVGSRAHTLSFDNCVFKDNQASVSGKNGGVFHVANASTLTFTDCTFTNNTANGIGGVMSIGDNSTAIFDGCTFTKNHAGNGGVFNVVSGSNAVITCEDCTFGDGTAEGANYANNGGGVLYSANAKTHTFTECLFNYNEARGNWGACLYLYGTNGRLDINRCHFENNVAKTRGVIAANATSDAYESAHLIYLNATSFNGNTVTGDSSDSYHGYGCVVHGNKGTTVCMNNVTTYNNYCTAASPGNNNWTLNLDGSWLIVNSTFIDKGRQHVLRQNLNDASADVSICNNIVIQVDGMQNYPIWIRNVGTIVNGGHNLRGGTSAGNINSSLDKFSVTESDLGGSFSKVWNSSDKYGFYSWTFAIDGFTKATQEEIENTITGFNHSAAGVTSVGTDFYNWLNSIGARGKDARGVSRSGSWWPGAYQN